MIDSFSAACAEDSSLPTSPVVFGRIITGPTVVLWVVESAWLEKLTVASFQLLNLVEIKADSLTLPVENVSFSEATAVMHVSQNAKSCGVS